MVNRLGSDTERGKVGDQQKDLESGEARNLFKERRGGFERKKKEARPKGQAGSSDPTHMGPPPLRHPEDLLLPPAAFACFIISPGHSLPGPEALSVLLALSFSLIQPRTKQHQGLVDVGLPLTPPMP